MDMSQPLHGSPTKRQQTATVSQPDYTEIKDYIQEHERTFFVFATVLLLINLITGGSTVLFIVAALPCLMLSTVNQLFLIYSVLTDAPECKISNSEFCVQTTISLCSLSISIVGVLYLAGVSSPLWLTCTLLAAPMLITMINHHNDFHDFLTQDFFGENAFPPPATTTAANHVASTPPHIQLPPPPDLSRNGAPISDSLKPPPLPYSWDSTPP